MPLLLTCFHEREAAGEATLLRLFEARVAVASRANPFARRAVVAPQSGGADGTAEEAAAAAQAERAEAALEAAAGAGGEGVSSLRLQWVVGSSPGRKCRRPIHHGTRTRSAAPLGRPPTRP